MAAVRGDRRSAVTGWTVIMPIMGDVGNECMGLGTLTGNTPGVLLVTSGM